MTLVCVSIMVQGVEAALRDAAAAGAGGADIVEFRLDEFYEPEGQAGESARSASGAEDRRGVAGQPGSIDDIVHLVSESPIPCITTCRTTTEGGHYDGDEPSRIALFERLGTSFGPREHPPRYLDVELSTLDRSANVRQKVRLAVEHPEQVRDLRTSLIVSTHDFTGRPADLTRRLLRMRDEPAARVLKVAYRARSLRDNLELFDLLAERDRPTIALGMGEFGLMSRVLAAKFGGFLTYCGLRDQATTAPGQPTLDELLNLYRFRSIGPATRVYGIVGWPLGHSHSPRMHNEAFAAAGYDGVYLPLPIPGEADNALLVLKATLMPLIDHPRLGLAGVSVTHPFKAALVELARMEGWTIDGVSAAVGAANTLVLARDGSARVLNTDAPAVHRAVAGALGDLAGKTIAILGAGGMARAAAYACANAGAHVEVFNRTPERARALAEAIGATTGRGTVPGGGFDAAIHCTPLGMAGSRDEGRSPMTTEQLRAMPGTLVLDTVYNPRDTPLLCAARDAGLRTLDGLGVFMAQAAAQFAAWTGVAPPAGSYSASS
ncbi:MAG: type I 3-dehydroquinate dehydratase [Phycisphaerales bacterium]|nr:type I 3-dehydroquinate dehydratase [Phycisphaerales bacterium]